jgi:hypothetical protein
LNLGYESESEEVEPMELESVDLYPESDSEMYDEIEDRDEANRRLNALYLLKTKEVNLLTQKATNDIVQGTTALVQNTVEVIRKGLQNRLDSAGIAFDAIPGLEDLFAEDHPISNPFEHVSTKHKQAAYFKEQFGLVVSII